MARGRMISKVLSTSARRANLHRVAGDLAEFAQGLYPLLVAHADDHGRLQGDVSTVKLAIDPSSPRSLDEFEHALYYLHVVRLIVWYETQDRKLIQINKFDEHQSGLHKRTTSRFPEVPENSGTFWKPPESSGIHGNSTENSGTGISGNFREIPESTALTELKGTELKGTEGNLTELNLKIKAAAWPPRARPVETVENPDDNVEVITTLVRKELLPMGIPDDELIEATKDRCAKLKIPYDSGSVRKAVESALVRHTLVKAGR